jgi:hypothetical protein
MEKISPVGISMSVDYHRMALHLTSSLCEGFYKCCISNTMNVTEEMSYSDNEEDRKVTSECEEDKVTECEDGQHTNNEG